MSARGWRTRAWAWVVAAAAVSFAAGPARAVDPEEEAPARFFFDRIELGGGWSRQHCDEMGGTERATLRTQGVRILKFLGPISYVGLDLGNVDRDGSSHPALGKGTTGAVQVGLEDEDLAWSGGVTLNPRSGFPHVNTSARIGRRDALFLSASYAHSVPVFSSDDVDVGMGAGVGDAAVVWFGASTPVNRDVVGFKAAVSVRPVSRLEVVGSGRYGNSVAGRIEGFAVSVAYVNPEGAEAPVPRGGLGQLLGREPARVEYLGAGGIVGTMAGVLVAGAAVQRPCGEAAFTPAVLGAVVGGLLGALLGNAMY